MPSISMTPIVCLLLRGGPSAVLRLVISVVVDAVKRVRWGGPAPHICNEIGERMPAFTNGDPSRPVKREFWIGRLFASVKHTSPSAVFWNFVGKAMCFVESPNSLCAETSARRTSAIEKVSLPDFALRSTLTLAKPVAIARRAHSGFFYYCPSAKGSTLQVVRSCFRHDALYYNVDTNQ